MEVLITDFEEAPAFVVGVVNSPEGGGVERGHVVDEEAVEVSATGDFEANRPDAIDALADRVGRGMTVLFRGSDHERYVVRLRGVESEDGWLGERLITWRHACEL